MDTNALKKFAQGARNLLIDQVTAKLDLVIDDAAPARREHPKAVKDLENAIAKDGKQQVIEQVAYTWFNRFTALRFMDVNGYTQVRVVSPAEGATRPEILSEALASNLPDGAPATIAKLLDGRTPSNDPQAEAYRLLLVHACNQWHGPMPFLFEEIDDYTELLMPEDLLSQTSILAELRKVMTEDACQDVEIIGWLYQFYISEKKDQVFAGLKKNQKITAENIPAATQLFTPHWIVRYLVENSLGRLWLLNRPQSRLAERMDYYIAPEEPETDFLKITKPEDIRICDPAAGSGHMLTYAFDLLYAIYEEEGYDATEIPALVLTHNLTGVEIDDRAGALAAFALAMKAAGKLGRRRFLRMEAKPDICVLQNVAFTEAEMQDVAAVLGKDLFTDELRETLGQFEQAKNFGSLIVPKLRDPAETLRVVEARDFGGDLLLKEVQARVVAVLRMAEALSPKYHVVVANPPYAGAKGLNSELGAWLKKRFPDSRSDLMTSFMDRVDVLTKEHGFWGMINLHSWMFLKSYEGLRRRLVSEGTFASLVHLGRGVFGSDFGSVAFVIRKSPQSLNERGVYRRLFKRQDEVRASDRIAELFVDQSYNLFRVDQSNFRKIPGVPIAYWIPERMIAVFDRFPPMQDIVDARQGMSTSDNDTFLRFYWEVSSSNTSLRSSNDENARASGRRWFPHNKGGPYRKWAGNYDLVVDWEDQGARIKETVIAKYPYLNGNPNFVVHDEGYYFKSSISWSEIGLEAPAIRHYPEGFTFNIKGMSAFPLNDRDTNFIIAYSNSCFVKKLAPALNPTMSFGIGNYKSLPGAIIRSPEIEEKTSRLIFAAKSDWDAFETSWDFTTLPLLQPDYRAETLDATYATLRTHWQGMTDEMQRLEEENNRIFIDAYGLQDELTPEVPLNEITLTCNPVYRYGIKNDVAANETRLRADTMAEFLSYAVGCMFGRYSLDASGLILANQGETLADYLARIPEPQFMPDEDNVIPVLDADWFADD
ncbi:MAG: BREX-1 system adenine-specific DNA-methyltransferase PglX, partial [Sulfitobacter sp.]